MTRIALGLLVLLNAACAYAAGPGAEFLRVDNSARALAMGSAFTASGEGSMSLSYNPAGLAGTHSLEVGFSHTDWFLDTSHDHAAAALPTGGIGSLVLGFGITRMNSGAMRARSADRTVGTDFTSYDQAITLGLAKAYGALRAGLALKHVQGAIAGERAATLAMDFGLSRSLGKRLPLIFGTAVRNLGGTMRYMTQKDRLPLTLSGGVAAGLMPGVMVVLELERDVYGRRTRLNLGSEYALLSALTVRGGLISAGSGPEMGGNGVSLGAGVALIGVTLDFSAATMEGLGSVQKLTLTRRL